VGKSVDIDKFEELMDEQRKRSQASWKGSGDTAKEGDFKELLEKFGKNEFVGYENIVFQSKILTLLDENFKIVNSLDSGEKGWVMLDKTPFYAESGGQCGDSGELLNAQNKPVAEVLDTRKFFDLNLSEIEAKDSIKTGQSITAKVDISREEIKRHHSATHILHSALKHILGDHVNQAGSLVLKDRLRFDFSHPKALTSKEIEDIQDFVNEIILRAIPQQTEIMDIEDAKKSGAMALFGEKYSSKVRVVSFGDISKELCGGTHVKNSSEIGSFYITKESGVSAGVRRIEALCSKAAYEYAKGFMKDYAKICEDVKNRDPFIGIKRLKDQIQEQKTEIQKLQNSTKKELKTEKIGDCTVLIQEVDAGDIKAMIDDFKNRYDKICVMLFQKKGDKVVIASGVKNAPVKAGAWIREVAPVLGGNGGGRDDFAQAGGKDASKIQEAMAKAKEYIEKSIGK
ncbi:MAG: alanine--tRNA ligase, partial [Epsilonproteobacteria bacterium]|nr:alanine--tRNA ligase [Campylobacterota bacterium]